MAGFTAVPDCGALKQACQHFFTQRRTQAVYVEMGNRKTLSKGAEFAGTDSIFWQALGLLGSIKAAGSLPALRVSCDD